MTVTTAETCDRCGVRAGARVDLPSGATLGFCRHHLRENRAALKAKGATIVVTATQATPTADDD